MEIKDEIDSYIIREELVVLSGQIINGIMSSDSSFLTKLFDRTLHEGAAKITVDLAHKIQQEIDKKLPD